MAEVKNSSMVLLVVSSHDISTHFSHCKEAQHLVLGVPENAEEEQEGNICCQQEDRDLFLDTVLSLDTPHELVFGTQGVTPQQREMCKRMYYQFKFPLSVKELSFHPISISPKTTFISFGARNPTLHFLISVSVHGNEPCGVHGINELLQEGWFQGGNIPLSSIRVTVILGNPGAFVAKKRFIEENLNRVMSEEIFAQESTYERKLAKRLAQAIKKADVYLDIHSTSSDSVPFALPAKNKKSETLALSLPCQFSIKNLAHLTNPKATSMEWAFLHNKTAVCVECGQHNNPKSVEVAKEVIKTTILSQCTLILAKQAPQEEDIELVTTRTCCSIDQTFQASSESHLTELDCESCTIVRKGFQFLRKVSAFETVPYGEAIARDEQGIVSCPYKEGAVVIMPTALPILGEEAFFWGIKRTSAIISTPSNSSNSTFVDSTRHHNPEKTSHSKVNRQEKQTTKQLAPFPTTPVCSPSPFSSQSLHLIGKSF